MYCARPTNFARCLGFSSDTKCIFVCSRDRGVIDLDDVQRGLAADTRVLVTSYVQFSTGFRQDLVVLGRLCRERNLIFVVDATQGMGVFPIDATLGGKEGHCFSERQRPARL